MKDRELARAGARRFAPPPLAKPLTPQSKALTFVFGLAEYFCVISIRKELKHATCQLLERARPAKHVYLPARFETSAAGFPLPLT